MKNYELLYIVSSNITPQEVRAVFDEINGLISSLKGKRLETPPNHPFLKTDAQGQKEKEQQNLADLPIAKKRLAYPVKKNKNGYYVLNNFSLEADKIIEFDGKIKFNKNILRHIIIQTESLSQEQIKRLMVLAAKKKEEKGGKKETVGSKRIKPAAKQASGEKELGKIEKIKEEKIEAKKAPEVKEVKVVEETKIEKVAEEKETTEKKKPKGKKIKLDDLEKKLDKILDETII